MDDTDRRQEKKLAKIAKYGRAHQGPRKRRRKPKKEIDVGASAEVVVTLESLRHRKPSRLPLVNAETTASLAAFSVLDTERLDAISCLAQQFAGSCIEEALKRFEQSQVVRQIKVHKKPKRKSKRTQKHNRANSRKASMPSRNFSAGGNHSRNVSRSRKAHTRARSHNFNANPHHLRAQSMVNQVQDHSMMWGDNHIGMDRYGQVFTQSLPPFYPHTVAYQFPFGVQQTQGAMSPNAAVAPWAKVHHRPGTWGGRMSHPVGGVTESVFLPADQPRNPDSWWIARRSAAPRKENLRDDTATDVLNVDDCESLELLVQDLALALPKPSYTVPSDREDNDDDTSLDSSKQYDMDRDERVALAIKLAEDEQERRVAEILAENLKGNVERAQRIEWAINAIEQEKLRRATEASLEGASEQDATKECLDDYEVVCPYSMVGCEYTCLRSELPNHLPRCLSREESMERVKRDEFKKIYNPLDHVVMCPFRVVGCNHSCTRALLPEHLLTCPNRPEANENEMYLKHSWSRRHDSTFSVYEIVCPYTVLGCEHICLRSELPDHLNVCPFHSSTRQEEEAERRKNAKLAIDAAEIERTRRVNQVRNGMQRERVDNADMPRKLRQKKAEWVVKAAQIERLRQVYEQVALASEGVRARTCSLNVDEYGDDWGHQSDGSVIMLSESEDDGCSTNTALPAKSGSSQPGDALPQSSTGTTKRMQGFYRNLQDEILALSGSINSLNKAQSDPIQLIVCQVKEVIGKLWPGSQFSVDVFGSYATGIAVPGVSDLDLVITTPVARPRGSRGSETVATTVEAKRGVDLSDVATARWVRQSAGGMSAERFQAALMCGLLGRLFRSTKWVSNVVVIETAQVPLIKLSGVTLDQPVERPLQYSKLDVDLTFALSSHAGLEAVELVKKLGARFRALIPIMQVLKLFLAKRNLNNPFTGGLSSYALVLMVVASLRRKRDDQHVGIEGVGQQLVNFLELFGKDFDSTTQKVAGFKSRNENGMGGVEIQIAKRKDGLVEGNSDKPYPMLVVDDPLRPGNNVAHSCFAFPRIRTTFEEVFAKLLASVVRCPLRSKIPTSEPLLKVVFGINIVEFR